MRRLRAAAALAALAIAGAGPAAVAPDAGAAEPREILRAALDRVTVRYGVVHESMVVLPLVLAEDPAAPPAGVEAGAAPDPPAAPALQPPGTSVTWRKSRAGGASLVELAGPAGATPVSRFVPGGSLLVGAERERLLDGPVPLLDAERATAPSVLCDGRDASAAPAAADAVLRVGRLAPVEQRKMQLLGTSDAFLPLLQRVQGLLAGLPGTARTVCEILDSPTVTDGERARMAVLSKLPGAYAGRTAGHVVFFGFRPVEVVLFARPEDYRSLGPSYLRAAAVSHTLWVEVMGAVVRKATDDDVRDLGKQGAAIVRRLATARTSQQPSAAGERRRWTSRVGRTEGASGRDDRTESFLCRVVLDDAQAFVCLEAYENGAQVAYAEPYRGPGQRPVSEPPDNKGNGPMTPEAMERILLRIQERRGR